MLNTEDKSYKDFDFRSHSSEKKIIPRDYFGIFNYIDTRIQQIQKSVEDAISTVQSDPLLQQMLEDPDSGQFATQRAKEIFDEFLYNDREDAIESYFNENMSLKNQIQSLNLNCQVTDLFQSIQNEKMTLHQTISTLQEQLKSDKSKKDLENEHILQMQMQLNKQKQSLEEQQQKIAKDFQSQIQKLTQENQKQNQILHEKDRELYDSQKMMYEFQALQHEFGRLQSYLKDTKKVYESEIMELDNQLKIKRSENQQNKELIQDNEKSYKKLKEAYDEQEYQKKDYKLKYDNLQTLSDQNMSNLQKVQKENEELRVLQLLQTKMNSYHSHIDILSKQNDFTRFNVHYDDQMGFKYSQDKMEHLNLYVENLEKKVKAQENSYVKLQEVTLLKQENFLSQSQISELQKREKLYKLQIDNQSSEKNKKTAQDIISLKEEIRGKDSELQNLEKELDTYKNINHQYNNENQKLKVSYQELEVNFLIQKINLNAQTQIKNLRKKHIQNNFQYKKMVLKLREYYMKQIYQFKINLMTIKSQAASNIIDAKNDLSKISQVVSQKLSQNTKQNQIELIQKENIQNSHVKMYQKEIEFLKGQLKSQRNQSRSYQSYITEQEQNINQIKQNYQEQLQRIQTQCKSLMTLYYDKLKKINEQVLKYENRKQELNTKVNKILNSNQKMYYALQLKKSQLKDYKEVSLQDGSFSFRPDMKFKKSPHQYSSHTNRSNYNPKKFTDEKVYDKKTKQMMSQLQDLKSLQRTISSYKKESQL